MSKVKISEIALESGKKTKEVLDACELLGIAAKAQSSAVSLEDAEKLIEYLISGVVPESLQKPKPTKKEPKKQEPEAKPKKAEANKSAKLSEPKQPAAVAPIEVARKKGGITLVKKARENKQTETIETRSAPTASYGRQKVASDLVEESKKKKKDKKIQIAKKDGSQRIELMIDRELESKDTYEDDLVYIPDLFVGVSTFLEEQARNQKAAKREFEKAKTISSATNKILGETVSKSKKKRPKKIAHTQGHTQQITAIEIAEDARVYEFADLINQPIAQVIKKLFELGMMVTKNDFLGKDAIEILAEEFGVEIKTKDRAEEMDYVAEYDNEHKDSKHKTTRPPIITIMGHVDHGKTSLLDYIRSSRIAGGEAGGITQHIGAYTVSKSGKALTFMDTPGHEVFTHMRARGANATDIVIIVVAADDGVMPQTKEAISHAKAANAPIIVAINKIDKPTANLDKVKAELAEAGLTPVDWGGDIECVGVSAKTGDGVETLLETILLQAEIMDLMAEKDTFAKAVVIEGSLEKGRGAVATVIVQNGTLKVGDNVVAGNSSGRVRAILNDRGEQIKSLNPSEAGEIVGLDTVPSSGDIMIAMADIDTAKEVAKKRSEYERARALSKSTKATMDDLSDLIAEGRLKSLPIILKADVQGTLEAIADSLSKLRNDEVKVDIVHSAVGAISESDIALASASEHSLVIGFNIKPSQIIKDKAKALGVRIASFDVIYNLLEAVRSILGGMLSPVKEEKMAGKAEVRQIFDIPRHGRIAGCMVMDGEIIKGAIARVMRGEDEIYKGKIETLKRFKDDVKEVKKGLECGIALEGFNLIEAGDLIEVYKSVEVKVEFEANI